MRKAEINAESQARRAGRVGADSAGGGVKCRIQLSPDPDCLDRNSKVDWLGNNAAFECPVCGNVFIVACRETPDGRIVNVDKRQSDNSKPNERKCPRCKMSVAHVTGPRQATAEGTRDGEAWIEWPVEKEAE